MNNLEQVVQRAKADIAKGYVFVHMKGPLLEILLEGLEAAQKEIKRRSTCPDCGGAEIVVMCNDPYYAEPCICTVDWMSKAFELAEEMRTIRAEHDTTKEKLEKANIALYTYESYDRTISEMHIENERLEDALAYAMNQIQIKESHIRKMEETHASS